MPPSRRPNRTSKSSGLTTEQKRLLKQQDELRKREEEIERKLSELPAKVRERKRRDRELQQLDVATVARGEWLGRVRSSRNTGTATRRRPLRGEARAARIKFFVLCLILGVILILLWQVIPA